ncbi:MAG: MBL fold metallo-hydrolase [Clostridiales bacterium]|nr:MBL fold metallo-hydrolase [Clostridiales bacterium]
MKRTLCGILSLFLLCGAAAAEDAPVHKLLYQGHGSLRVVTAEGKVIYIDPYAGEGYDLPADLILMTHGHQDHTAVKLIKTKNEGCRTISWKEALVKGEYKTFDLGYAVVEAVQAGNNKNHNIRECVGWVITLSGGVTLYVSGDTSATDQMKELAERDLHYAFFCCDGKYNMDVKEAAACAKTVNARFSIPYHMAPGKLFDRKTAEQFDAPNRLIVPAGEEITLE